METASPQITPISIEQAQSLTGIGLLVLRQDDLASYPGGFLRIYADGQMEALNEDATLLLATLAEEDLNSFSEWLEAKIEEGVGSFLLSNFFPDHTIILLPISDGAGWIGFTIDVSIDRNVRNVLAESRQRYKDLVELSTDYVWEINSQGRFTFISPHGFLGYPASQVVGMTPEDFIIGWDTAASKSPFLTRNQIDHMNLSASSRDGKLLHLIISAKPLFDHDGEWYGVRGVCRDITEEKQSERSLRIKNQLMLAIRDVASPATMLQIAVESVARVLGARGCQIFFKDSHYILKAKHGRRGDLALLEEILEQEDTVHERFDEWQAMASVCYYHQKPNGVLCVWRQNDDPPWAEVDSQLLAEIANQIGIINEQVASHEHILHLSRTDGLTGLYNRRAFFEELERYLARLQYTGKPGALIYIDLDNFKTVNDRQGHMMGDKVLRLVKDLLLAHSRPEDLTGRLGGDEFALWLNGADETIARRRCDELLKAVKELDHLSGDPDKLFGFSLGVAMYDPKTNETIEDLVIRADGAMYAAKHGGKGGLTLAPPADIPSVET